MTDIMGEERRKARFRLWVPLIIILIAFVLGAVVSAWLSTPKRMGKNAQSLERSRNAVVLRVPDSMGSADAKLKIDFLFPTNTDCQLQTLEFLVFLGKTYPRLAYIRFFSLTAPPEKRGPFGDQMNPCSTIFVDGRSFFMLPTGDGRKKGISFSGPSGAEYSLQELRDVLRYEMKKLQIEAPSGFDSLVERFRKADKTGLRRELVVGKLSSRSETSRK